MMCFPKVSRDSSEILVVNIEEEGVMKTNFLVPQ